MKRLYTSLSTLLIFTTGIAISWFATDGWQSWTAESARRLAVLNNPVELIEADIVDASNRPLDFSRQDDTIYLVDFIFTRCPSVCGLLGNEFAWIQRELKKRDLQDRVKLVSLSFDFEHDSSDDIKAYLDRYAAIDSLWRGGRFERKPQLTKMMNQLGVVAIPDIFQGFVHNAAIYMVSEGKVIGIYDLGNPGQLLEAVAWQYTKI